MNWRLAGFSTNQLITPFGQSPIFTDFDAAKIRNAAQPRKDKFSRLYFHIFTKKFEKTDFQYFRKIKVILKV